MADKIVVMRDGYVEQVGEPLDLYDFPANRFVAGFIGSPAMNFVEGTIVRNGDGVTVRTRSGALLPISRPVDIPDGTAVTYAIRPQHFEMADASTPGAVPARVSVIEPTGAETMVLARIGDDLVTAVFYERHSFRPGDQIFLKLADAKAHLFDVSGQRI